MKKTILTLMLITLSTISNAQTFKNFTKIHEYNGDFNNDHQIDKIIVFEKVSNSINSTENSDEKDRRLAIYLRKNNRLELLSFNDSIIECSVCGGAGVGDPFQSITIKNEYFSIENLYGACDKTFKVITFKYDKKQNNFYLHKIGTEDYNCREEANPNGEIKVTTNTKTIKNFGSITFKKYNL